MNTSNAHSDTNGGTAAEKNAPVILYQLKGTSSLEVVYVSPSVETLLGIKPEDILGPYENWTNRVHDTDRALMIAEPGDQGWIGREYRISDNDSHWKWVCDQRNCSVDDDGVTLISGAVMIIDERIAQDKIINDERLLHMSGPSMVFRWENREGWPVNYASPNIQEILGYSPEQMMLNDPPYSSIVHPDDIDRVAREVQDALAMGIDRFEHLHYRIKTSAGDTLWVSDHTIAIRDDYGKVTHFLGHLLDVTHQKRIEEAYQSQVERLDMVIRGTNAGIWDWNIQTGKTIFNERWAEIIGYHLDELQPISIETWISNTHPDDLEESNRLIQDHLEGKTEFYECECRMKHRDGHWVWVLDRGKVMERDEEGKPVRMTGTHIDITARKEAEIARKENEERLRQDDEKLRRILQTSLDGFFIVNDKGAFSEVNRAYSEMIGYSQEECVGLSLADVEIVESPEETEKHIQYIIEHGADRFETKHKRKDGVVIDIEVSTTMLVSDAGVFFATFCRDVTEQRRIEKALFENNQMMESFFNQSLDGFFFMMSDEPVEWNESVDKEVALEYLFSHQRITKINDAMLIQYRATEDDFIGLRPIDFFEHDQAHGKDVWRTMLDQGALHLETDERRFDGEQMWIEGDYVCLYDVEGRFTGHFGIQRDVTREKEALESLKREEEKFRQLAENIDEVFWLRTENEMIYINPAYEKIWGRSVAMLYQRPDSFMDAVHPDDIDAVKKEFIQNNPGFNMQYRIVRPDETVRWIWARSFAVTDDDGNVTRTAGIAVDITERKEFEEKLRQISIKDPLTDIYNRRHIFERLEAMISRHERTQEALTLAILDIDFFKNVNDTYGHLAGDAVLKQFASTIRKGIRDYDLLGRYGGEEFIIIFPTTDCTCARDIVERLRVTIEESPVIYEDKEISYTFSGGIAGKGMITDGLTAEKLMEIADRNLYRAKERGRNRIVLEQ